MKRNFLRLFEHLGSSPFQRRCAWSWCECSWKNLGSWAPKGNPMKKHSCIRGSPMHDSSESGQFCYWCCHWRYASWKRLSDQVSLISTGAHGSMDNLITRKTQEVSVGSCPILHCMVVRSIELAGTLRKYWIFFSVKQILYQKAR